MIAGTWYERPAGDRLSLSRAPRLASWNKATDPDQIKLRQYLDEAVSLLGATQPIVGPWALLL